MCYFSIDLVTLGKVWYRDHNFTQYIGSRTHKAPLPTLHSSPMQWIGIRDRNGNNIFELDIIERKIKQDGETVGIERGLIVFESWYFTIIRFGLDESYIGTRLDSDWSPSCELSVVDEEFFEECTMVGNFYEDGRTLPDHISTIHKISAWIKEAEKRSFA